MKFQRYVKGKMPVKRPLPQRMEVGQVVVRLNIKPAYKASLNSMMIKAMREQGMVFSVATTGRQYAIRRDE